MSISVNIPDDLGARLADVAKSRDISVDQLATELLSEQVPDRLQLRAFLGMGASTFGRGAAEGEAMLAEGFGR